MKDPYDAERRKWRSFPRRRPGRIEPVGPGQESVWDYPRPPRVERVTARVRIVFADREIARSTSGLRVCETASPPVVYLPFADVDRACLRESDEQSFCEWKGLARYWHLEVGDRRSENAAWSYPNPDAGFEALRDHVAFYPGRVDECWLAGERVRPQPGEFYGGWVTSAIRGPFKGEPGTGHW